MPREINAAGYQLIKEFEAGPSGNSQPALMPYLCPAGKLTNGWGNTHNVKPGLAITLAQAEMDLARNLDWAEACVERYATAPNDNEFAAMVSLCFNIGPDPGAGFPSSTVLRLHNRGDKAGAAAAFAMWRKMRDPGTGSLVDSAGLLRRRNVEANLYLTSVTALTVSAMPQAVAPEKPAVASKSILAGGVAVAGGAASIADQINQAATAANTAAAAGSSLIGMAKQFGPVALSAIAFAAAAYFLWRYIQKRRRGEVLST